MNSRFMLDMTSNFTKAKDFFDQEGETSLSLRDIGKNGGSSLDSKFIVYQTSRCIVSHLNQKIKNECNDGATNKLSS